MPRVEGTFVNKVINLIERELQILIVEEQKDKIINYFYVNEKYYVYWSCNIETRHDNYFFDGVIKKTDYEKIKKIDDADFTINIDKVEDMIFNEINFSNDLDTVYFHLKKGSRYDLMDIIISIINNDDLKYKKKYGRIFNLK